MAPRRKLFFEEDSTPAPAATPPPQTASPPTRKMDVAPKHSTVTAQGAKAKPPKGSGNGHKCLKERELSEGEKSLIKNDLFLHVNGCILTDVCKEFKERMLPPEVSIAQVTGYVTALHGQVARGVFSVRDPDAYENILKGHRNLWVQYDSPRYRAMRDRFRLTHRLPKHTAFPSRQKVA